MRELTDALNNKVEENRFGMKLVVVTYMHLGGQSLKETGAGSKGVVQWFIQINSTADEIKVSCYIYLVITFSCKPP